MKFKNLDKGDIHQVFPQFFSKIPVNFIFWDTALILCLSCRKITLIHRRLCYELNNKIIQLSLDCPFWYFLSTGSELYLQLVFQCSTGKTGERGTRKAIFRSVTVYNINLYSQCNFTAQIKQVWIKNIVRKQIDLHWCCYYLICIVFNPLLNP